MWYIFNQLWIRLSSQLLTDRDQGNVGRYRLFAIFYPKGIAILLLNELQYFQFFKLALISYAKGSDLFESIHVQREEIKLFHQ